MLFPLPQIPSPMWGRGGRGDAASCWECLFQLRIPELGKFPQDQFGDSLGPLWDRPELKLHWSSDFHKLLFGLWTPVIVWVSWNSYQVRVSVHKSPTSSGDFLFPHAVTLLGGGSSPTTSKPLSHGSQSRVVLHSSSVKMSSSCLQSFIEWLCHLLFKPGHFESKGRVNNYSGTTATTWDKPTKTCGHPWPVEGSPESPMWFTGPQPRGSSLSSLCLWATAHAVSSSDSWDQE